MLTTKIYRNKILKIMKITVSLFFFFFSLLLIVFLFKHEIREHLIFLKMFVKVDNYPNKKSNDVRLRTFFPFFIFLFYKIMVSLLLIFFRKLDLFSNSFSNGQGLATNRFIASLLQPTT
jgi:hypothetical protein